MHGQIINAAVLASEAKPATVRTPMQLFMSGYLAGIRGALLEEMQTEDEVDGWWYSRQPESATQTVKWLVARLEEQQNGREDAEQWRLGQW